MTTIIKNYKNNLNEGMDEKIKNFPFDELFKILGIKLEETTNNIARLYNSDGKMSHGGWHLNKQKNKVYNRGGKERPNGDPFNFVRILKNLGTSKQELSQVYLFFKEILNGENVNFKFLDINNEKDLELEKERKERFEKSLQQYNSLPSNLENNRSLNYIKKRCLGLEFLLENGVKFGKLEGYKDDKFLFPMKDSKGKIIGIRVRTYKTELKQGEFKVWAAKDSNSGFMYDFDLNDLKDRKQVFLCEGEIDYISLKTLGYKNVVGNIGGVLYLNDDLKKILGHFQEIVVLYDNDLAGFKGLHKVYNEFYDKNIKFLNFLKLEDLNNQGLLENKGELGDINDMLKGFDKKYLKDLLDSNFNNFDDFSNEIIKIIDSLDLMVKMNEIVEDILLNKSKIRELFGEKELDDDGLFEKQQLESNNKKLIDKYNLKNKELKNIYLDNKKNINNENSYIYIYLNTRIEKFKKDTNKKLVSLEDVENIDNKKGKIKLKNF